ncbi:probable carboxylesterase 18 [Mangifera indica]|uniref:probable carboxylesterase 18 n=1 Tax=Mangifera indica TaxID=29780 RepID=UPI001CF96F33|nr:probable carboxylesterase 18 [Mangifera indica]
MSQNPNTSPNLPWKCRLLMNYVAYLVDMCRRPNFTVNRRLYKLFDLKSSPSKTPINGVTTSDIMVDASRNLWFRLFTPENGSGNDVSLPVIMYFHGGGFCFLGPDTSALDRFCKRLSRELHVVIVSVNYRLAPEYRFPCQQDDGVDVLKFLDTTNIEGFPACANLNHCFIAGDSAGGNLAHQVTLGAIETYFRKLKIIGLITIQPLLGGEERTESEVRLHKSTLMPMERTDWMWKAFLPEGSNRDHPACNVFGPNAIDVSGLNFPATAVVVGGFDTLQDWQKRYYKGLKESGKEVYLIEYPNAVHSFYAHPELPESSMLIEECGDFIRKQCAKT